MTTTIDNRQALMDILLDICHIYDGEIYAEDVNAVMNGLRISPSLYNKVSSVLEEVIPQMRKSGPSVEAAIQRNINLLLGLSALSV